jgi:hypothetical protein
VQNINELHDRIVRALECITSEMLPNIWWYTEDHLDVCCTTSGAHIDGDMLSV